VVGINANNANGNQSTRNKGVANQEQALTWDAENRLAAVTYTNRSAGGSSTPPPVTCNGVPCKRVYFPFMASHTPAERYGYDADGAHPQGDADRSHLLHRPTLRGDDRDLEQPGARDDQVVRSLPRSGTTTSAVSASPAG